MTQVVSSSLSDYYAKKEFVTSPIYRNFINSLKSPQTKRSYAHSLFHYYLKRPENQNLTLEEIISKSTKTIEYEIIEILYDMKERRKLSYATISTFLSVITHFFQINDVMINAKKLKKFRGENVAKFEYKSYTHEEIGQLLSLMDERGKAAVLLMASSGMRVGALPEIKLKHLKKWVIAGTNDYLYQITVYANSPKARYTTFCTPECAKAIDYYLEFRKRHGDNLRQDQDGNWTPGDSFLFIKNFDRNQRNFLGNLPLQAIFKLGVTPRTIAHSIITRLEAMGDRQRLVLLEDQVSSLSERQSLYSQHKHEKHPCHSLRIFAVTNMQRAKLDKTIREMLVGHSTGLDKSYYKPQDDEILSEYLKAVDLLTISNENRLKRQLDFYKQRADKLEMMNSEIEAIKSRLGINDN